MKTILGLDLGTNSIGWALIKQDFDNKKGQILGLGSRIIPMSQDVLGKFESGQSISQTAERTGYRGARRLRERFLLRRERLHRVLNVLNFLPEHYSDNIDFTKRLGQFISETEPKLVYNCENEFIFKDSFEEMLADFKVNQPGLVKNDKKVPADWTIYYLRKKALTSKIEKEELAWLLLHFNQKRGYYQLRGEEEEENPNKLVEFHSLKVINVIEDERERGKSDLWYSLVLENGWIYRRSSKTPLFDWKDKTKEFIVTTDLNDDGSIKLDKEGKEKRSFRAPAETDWTLVKKKTESEIDKTKKTVGEYIYDTLLQNPNQKIKGKLIKTIERKLYKLELRKILAKQVSFHQELQNEANYIKCIEELYPNNEAHRTNISQRDFVYLFLEDILFYQRPLKSKKSLISDCSFESKYYFHDGIKKKTPLKCIAKSHPLYQEFRLWQWIKNLKIYSRENDEDETYKFIDSEEKYVSLFEFLNQRKEVNQTAILKYFKIPEKTYRWNFVDDKDKKYPCNETLHLIQSRIEKVKNIPVNFLNSEIVEKLWHIIYSVNDKFEYEKAIETFAKKYSLDIESFVENFKKIPPFKSEYGSYSAKAIKKLLPLMRMGQYWDWNNIDELTKIRIEKIQTGEFDENIRNSIREKSIHLIENKDFSGLPLWLTSYIVYDRHSNQKWKTAIDLEAYIKSFKQHSLRNPIVEQIVSETFRVVNDIWKQFGEGKEHFFDEIHVELGREMKNPADKRKRITSQVTENENTNLRIKALLSEMLYDSTIENVRSYSPMQHDILKIYEEGVLTSNIEIPDDIAKISKSPQPTKSELIRYKLWLEQKYLSPYTGQTIPLSRLFTSDYEIEHIIPQSRFYDDSFSNKVICESAVNKLKSNQTGREFIKNHHDQIVDLGFGKTVKIFDEESYEFFVKDNYNKNQSKKSKLLMEDIPEKMIERQLNDTRFISKFVMATLSNIVREDKNDDGVNSKNVLPLNGQITSSLKQSWGLNDVWNELILPRFERLNELTNSENFTTFNKKHQKYLPTVPLELSKGFSKKRIDHRHHALDALVIACSTRNHVNYLNNQNALEKNKSKEEKQKNRNDLKVVLCDKKYNDASNKNYHWEFKQPWKTFVVDSKKQLETTVVSFKQNVRVINKSVNKPEKWVLKAGLLNKEQVAQTKGNSWSIRKPMHKAFVYGKIDLKRIITPKGKIISAIRKSLDISFNLKKIDSITDTGIQKILKNYLETKEWNPEIAFSHDGIEYLNENITKFNDGKMHKPIKSVRVFEIGSRFPIGQTGNKQRKFVEAAQGTNLFYAIYVDETGKRNYETIPLNIVIERQKQGLISVPEKNEKGNNLLFYLSPNDLVYVLTEEEVNDQNLVDFSNLSKEQVNRIYKFVSCTGGEGHFVHNSYSKEIISNENGSNNKNERMLEFDKLNTVYDEKLKPIMIKSICWNLKIDRVGKITRVLS
ncbi:MAG: type II CRISPR RNA-guided endonuclease Cas9 [Flavobacteriia bacterium]|nr:type II CRISPR RNA-guided endonuclease Cas9 [Flavobacteriia bacterium]